MVDTGVWVCGQSVLIPAGAVAVIDTEARTVKVAPSREHIKAAPRFTTDSETADHRYLAMVGNYYLSLQSGAVPAARRRLSRTRGRERIRLPWNVAGPETGSLSGR